MENSILNEAKIEHDDGAYSYAADADYKPGEVLVRPDGSLAILDGLNDVKTGQWFTPRPLQPEPTGLWKVDPTGPTWAAGTEVFFNTTTNFLTNASAGAVKVGRSIDAMVAGKTKCHVVHTNR